MAFVGTRRALLGTKLPGWVLKGNGIAASRDLDFAGGRAWNGSNVVSPASLLTTSRASSGYASDAAGNWTLFGNNVPRITNQGLLVEESRTNSLVWSTDMTATSGTWGSNGLNTVVAVPGPDGNSTSAFFMQENSTAGITHRTAGTNASGNSTSTWTVSGFYKPNGRTWVRLQLSDAGPNNVAVYFNCTGAGSVGSTSLAGTGVSGTGKITAYSNGWFLVQATIVPSTANSTLVQGIWALATGDSISAYNGDGTSGGYWWNPQIELGSFATSPIRTTSAAVTRNADVVTLTSPPTFGSAYTLYWAGVAAAPTAFGTNQVFVSVNDGTNNNRAQLHRTSAGGIITSFIAAGGASQTLPTAPGNVQAQNASVKSALAISASSSNIAAAGSIGTDGGAITLPTITQTNIGSRGIGDSQYNGTLSRGAIWPTTRLPNAALQALTQ